MALNTKNCSEGIHHQNSSTLSVISGFVCGSLVSILHTHRQHQLQHRREIIMIQTRKLIHCQDVPFQPRIPWFQLTREAYMYVPFYHSHHEYSTPPLPTDYSADSQTWQLCSRTCWRRRSRKMFDPLSIRKSTLKTAYSTLRLRLTCLLRRHL